jgi:hypothetical protein
MTDSPLSSQDIRAAAEVHRELGPEYSDAVVESFLGKVDKHIEDRIEQRLASMPKRARRPVDPVRLAKRRTALAGAAIGSAVAGAPLTLVAWNAFHDFGVSTAPLLVIWVVLLAVYGLVAFRLRRR